MRKLKFDLDPSVARVVAIAILLFFESLLGGLLVILQKGGTPDMQQFVTILSVAGLALITYLLTFLRGEGDAS